MTNNTITVMKKELARFFGDRRLVITTLLLPGIMIYVVYSFLGSAMMKSILPEEAYVAKAYVVDMPESLREDLRELKVDWQPADREQLTQMRQEIQDKQADGLVVFPADFDQAVENRRPTWRSITIPRRRNPLIFTMKCRTFWRHMRHLYPIS